MKILKFGGTSVGNPDRMRALIPLINDDDNKIVVLSAMSGTTNNLVEITSLLYSGEINKASSRIEELRAKYEGVVNDLYAYEGTKQLGIDLINSHFEYILNFTLKTFTKIQEKAILAQGELISTALFHLLLQENNIRSILLPALSFMRIDKYGEPDLFYIEEKLKRELENHTAEKIIITQGYICRDAFGEIDNLKRGGSDFSASLIGAAINADEIQIWTDINGFHNNDPRYVKNTQVIRELSFDEAAELAYFGAKVIHPKTIKPLQNKSILLWVRDFWHPEGTGTRIFDLKTIPPTGTVFITKKNQLLISFQPRDFSFIVEDMISEIFAQLAKYRIKVNLMQHGAVSFSICVTADMDRVNSLIQAMLPRFRILYNSDLELVTIRRYNPQAIERMTAGRRIMIQQLSRKTARFVLA